MRYNKLGRTGLEVSALSLGGASFGGIYGPFNRAAARRTVAMALDSGINLIDSSPYYGRTESETFLGGALRGVARDRYYMATKVGRYGVDEFDFTYDRVIRSVDESLTRLGLDYIDIMQCHDIEFGDLDVVVERALPALARCKERGKVRFIGITGYPLKIFRYVIERFPVDTMLSYCHGTLQNDSLTGLIPWLRERGVGVMSGSILGMGLLRDGGPQDWHPASDDVKAACARANAICKSRGKSLAALAMAWSMRLPGIDTTLMGTAVPEEFAENLAALDAPVDEELLAAVQAELSSVKNREWPVGRPENQ